MLYFDITTLSQWGGPPTGVIRVERELFIALERALGSEKISPVIYHPPTRLFYSLRPDVTELIVSGRATMDFALDIPDGLARDLSDNFDSPSLTSVATAALDKTEKWIGNELDRRSPSYQERWTTQSILVDGVRKWWVPFLSGVSMVTPLGAADTVISAGLDWDFKDMRAVRILKNAKGFHYTAFVHDLVPIYSPQFVNPDIRHKLQRYFSDLVWVADTYICSTDFVISELNRFASYLTGSVPSISKLEFGSPQEFSDCLDDLDQSLDDFGLEDKPFILYVSTIEPRKNHRSAYYAWKRGIETGRIDPKRQRLVFAGMHGWLSSDLIQAIRADRSLEGSIKLLPGLSDKQIDVLYRGCAFGIFPSFVEGYGLAISETQARSKWIICSPAGSMREVAGESADFVDPDDILAWSSLISKYLSDPATLFKRQKKAKARSVPSWSTSVDNLIKSGHFERQVDS